ncbi:MAG: ABC transporter permease subunit [Clostridia bacterium]|nr:ABC transporter permease subunit [Clostridia bacterium]
MSKIFKLFINENIKTWKKFSTKLSIILIIVSLIGTLSFVKIIQKYEEKSTATNTINDWKFSAEKEIEYIKEILKDDSISDSDRRNFEITLEKYEMAIEYQINIYSSYWKNNLLNQITNLKQKGDTSQIAKLTEILKNNDFDGYINLQKEELKKQGLSQEEYDDKIMILDLQAKYEIGKNTNEDYWKTSILNETELFQQSVRTGIDYRTNKLLTLEQNQDYKDKIKINFYRLENDMPSTDYSVGNNFRILFEVMASNFVIVVIAITVIIIAGGAIATEVSTGTIKFWALTPNKRWKIMTAKIMSLLFYILIVTLIASLLTVIFANIFFNTDGNEYLYIKNGNVEKIGNTLFIIGYYFAKIMPVIVFAILSLMLSTITRNSSVAISLSLAIYMGNGIAMTIINSLLKKDWIKFIPFNNLNLADKIFPNFENPIAIMTGDIGPVTSLGFSLLVLGVCTILMLVTTYDSFNNRDII